MALFDLIKPRFKVRVPNNVFRLVLLLNLDFSSFFLVRPRFKLTECYCQELNNVSFLFLKTSLGENKYERKHVIDLCRGYVTYSHCCVSRSSQLQHTKTNQLNRSERESNLIGCYVNDIRRHK